MYRTDLFIIVANLWKALLLPGESLFLLFCIRRVSVKCSDVSFVWRRRRMLVYALTAPNCAAAVALWLADIETTNFRFHATIVVVVCTSRLSQNNCFRIRLPYAKRYFQLDSIHAYRQRQTYGRRDRQIGRKPTVAGYLWSRGTDGPENKSNVYLGGRLTVSLHTMYVVCSHHWVYLVYFVAFVFDKPEERPNVLWISTLSPVCLTRSVTALSF